MLCGCAVGVLLLLHCYTLMLLLCCVVVSCLTFFIDNQLKIYTGLTITHSSGQLALEWQSNSVNDMIADSAVAVVLQLESHAVIPKPKLKKMYVLPGRGCALHIFVVT